MRPSRVVTSVAVYQVKNSQNLLVIKHDVRRPDTPSWNAHLVDAAEILRVPHHQHVFPHLPITSSDFNAHEASRYTRYGLASSSNL